MATLKQIEEAAIQDALTQYNGDKKAAATSLGIGLKTLYNKLRRYPWGADLIKTAKGGPKKKQAEPDNPSAEAPVDTVVEEIAPPAPDEVISGDVNLTDLAETVNG